MYQKLVQTPFSMDKNPSFEKISIQELTKNPFGEGEVQGSIPALSGRSLVRHIVLSLY
jgi:hypothetical protein